MTKNGRIEFRIDESTKKKLEKIAKERQGGTIASLLREFILEGIKNCRHHTVPRESTLERRILLFLNKQSFGHRKKECTGRYFSKTARNLDPITILLNDYKDSILYDIIRFATKKPQPREYLDPAILFDPKNFENLLEQMKSCPQNKSPAGKKTIHPSCVDLEARWEAEEKLRQERSGT